MKWAYHVCVEIGKNHIQALVRKGVVSYFIADKFLFLLLIFGKTTGGFEKSWTVETLQNDEQRIKEHCKEGG